MQTSAKYPNLRPGAVPDRVGRMQRLTRRVLIAAGSTVTTAAFMAAIYPDEAWTQSRWRHMRRAAERFGERVGKRRPLLWRLKPGVLKPYQ